MFCNKNDHLKNYSYCQDCAISGQEAHMVFFCERCNRDIKLSHQAHIDEVKQIEHKKFTQPFSQLKSIIIQQFMGIKQKAEKNKQVAVNVSQIFKKLKTSELIYLKIVDDKQKFIDIIRNQKIMKWLLEIKFWQCSVEKSTFMKFEGRFQTQLEQKFIQSNKQLQKILKPAQQSKIMQKYHIGLEDNDSDEKLTQKLQEIKRTNYFRTKQKQISNTVIKMYQSYNMQDCYNTDDEFIKLINKYPDSKVLYLCRIRLNQLLPSGNKEIEKILNEIVNNVDKKFDSTDFYHYYKAMAQWEMTQSKGNQRNLIFFQLRNKKYYQMVNPDIYIDELNKAISIKQRPVYYISLGLGYIVKQNYHEALRVFKKANSMMTKRSDTLDSNKLWTQTQMDTNYRDFQAIMQNLQTRSLQFIVNICKYFKKSQNYAQLVECCQQLILREPNNQNFKIQFIKSILSYSSTLRDIDGENSQKINQAEEMIYQLKNAQDNSSAGKLDKKLKRLRAKKMFTKNQFYESTERYEELAKGTKLTTGSDYYNYAASLYRLFVEEQCTDEDVLKKSYEIINKALNLKQDNKKYKKLKFFICTYMNKFNEANEMFEDLKIIDPNIINQAQYERLIEYIKENQQY